MWITTKSIVKEIKKSQEDLVAKIDLLTAEQKKYSDTLQNQLEAISDRQENLVKTYMEERENNSNNYASIIKGLEELKQLLVDAQDKMCVTAKALEDSCKQEVSEGLKSIKENSDANVEKCNTIIMDNIREKIEQLEKLISEKSKDVVLETRNCTNDISEEIESISEEIQNALIAIASKDTALSDNIETMNNAMQEMLRNLLSLDEGNRLIIAKFLLKDMEI